MSRPRTHNTGAVHCAGDFSCLKVKLHFTRDKAFYWTTVFIPGKVMSPCINCYNESSEGIILVTSSFVTFWIEWNAVPARVMLGVTTMLNFFTTSNGFRSNLPVVSNLTAMNLWDAVCMGFIYTSFLEFVVVNYLARWVQDPDIQKRKRDNAILDVSMRSAQLGSGSGQHASLPN